MMSFIFGKKRPPPEVYVAEETPEGFTPVISGKPVYESPLPPYPPLPRPDTAGYPYIPPSPYPPQVSPYPVSPQASPYPPVSPRITPYTPASPYGQQHSASSNPLDSIPFVLAPALTIARTRFSSDVGPIRNQMDQLKDRLATKYNYDFSLERSVIQDYSNGL